MAKKKSTDKVLQEGDRIISFAESKFLKKVRQAEDDIINEVLKIFKVADISGGKLKTSKKTEEFLLTIDERIRAAMKQSEYMDGVKDLLRSYDLINVNNIELQKSLNDINVSQKLLTSAQRLEVANTTEKLLGQGVSRDFIIPIKESLYRSVMFGASVDDAEKQIRDYIVSNDGADSRLLRYAGQVARDSLGQYDGTIQGIISSELDLPDFIYAGSLINDSRGQCRYWVNKRILDHEELEDEIQKALDGGSLGGFKCSGMIPGTTVSSFPANRGGYRCRHRVVATKIRK